MSNSQASSSSNPLPRHDFFQSDEKFTLSIFVKGLKPEDVSVSFRERSVRFLFPFSLLFFFSSPLFCFPNPTMPWIPPPSHLEETEIDEQS